MGVWLYNAAFGAAGADRVDRQWVSTWSRSLAGIDGGFAVKVDQTGAATLELANMHGDIVATAFDDPNATGIQGGSLKFTFDARAASRARQSKGNTCMFAS